MSLPPPPCVMYCFAAARHVRKTPRALTANVRSHASGVVSRIDSTLATPALATMAPPRRRRRRRPGQRWPGVAPRFRGDLGLRSAQPRFAPRERLSADAPRFLVKTEERGLDECI
jgi:hypothetical protein